MRRGPYETIERRRGRQGIGEVPIDVTFIPGGTRILFAHGNHLERSLHWAAGVDGAIIRRSGKRRITSWICGSRAQQRGRARRRIELRQAVKRLIWIAISRPVLPKSAKIVFEPSILLRQNDDVVDLLKTASSAARGRTRRAIAETAATCEHNEISCERRSERRLL